MCEAGAVTARGDGDSEEAQARVADRIEAMVEAGELQRALKTATSTTPLCAQRKHSPEVAKLFPDEKIRAVEPLAGTAPDSELWGRLEKQIQRDMKRMARKAGPAMDGSRFEHWMGSSKEVRMLVARIGVAWAMGACP